MSYLKRSDDETVDSRFKFQDLFMKANVKLSKE